MSVDGQHWYVCSAAARWLPRTLAASVLASGWLAVSRIAAGGAASIRGLVVVLAGAAALWLLRKGGEVRLRLQMTEEGVRFEHRGRSALLRFRDIESVRYEAPFGTTRAWLPAAVLTDSDGRAWRLSALLDGGERLVSELVERSGRSDLAAWVDAQQIASKMARSVMRVRIGYATAAALLLAAAIHALR